MQDCSSAFENPTWGKLLDNFSIPQKEFTESFEEEVNLVALTKFWIKICFENVEIFSDLCFFFKCY